MEYFVLVIFVLALIVGFVLPVRKANLNDSPRCPKPANTDIKYHVTLKYVDDVPYYDDIASGIDSDEEWLYD